MYGKSFIKFLILSVLAMLMLGIVPPKATANDLSISIGFGFPIGYYHDDRHGHGGFVIDYYGYYPYHHHHRHHGYDSWFSYRDYDHHNAYKRSYRDDGHHSYKRHYRHKRHHRDHGYYRH